jgi:hypothetical protein
MSAPAGCRRDAPAVHDATGGDHRHLDRVHHLGHQRQGSHHGGIEIGGKGSAVGTGGGANRLTPKGLAVRSRMARAVSRIWAGVV